MYVRGQTVNSFVKLMTLYVILLWIDVIVVDGSLGAQRNDDVVKDHLPDTKKVKKGRLTENMVWAWLRIM